MKRHISYFLLIFVSLLFANSIVCAEQVGVITSVEYPKSKRIYFAPCQKNDSSIISFNLKTLLNKDTIILSRSRYLPTSPFYMASDTILLHKNNITSSVKCKFIPSDTENIGQKESMLIFVFSVFTEKKDSNLALQVDTFFLVGKCTDKSIDGFRDTLYFDSVFVNQPYPVTLQWQTRNTTKQAMEVSAQQLTMLSKNHTTPEFFVEEKSLPLTFYAGDYRLHYDWDVGYSPKDVFADTARFTITYYDSIAQNPDSAQVLIVGQGVSQRLIIDDYENCNIIKVDTIDFGQVAVGQSKNASLILRNSGNINFGLDTQMIYDALLDTASKCFTLNNGIDNILRISDNSSASICFTPTDKGTFLSRYVIRNNFKKRNIRSNNPSDYEQVFILKGTGITPIAKMEYREIDFGKVSYANANVECPAKKDTTMTIYNVGNAQLLISNVEIKGSAFIVSPTELIIPPDSFANISISYLPKPPEKYDSTILILRSNSPFTTDTLHLFARSIAPLESILQPQQKNYSVKPGTQLEIPFMLYNKSNNTPSAQYCNSYSFNLSYDTSLLQLCNWTTQQTASEGANITITNQNNGVAVNCHNQYSYLRPDSVLLILHFKTYLGNAERTEIAIQNPKFGQYDYCEDLLNVTTQNGSYSIDSIPGLQYKLQSIELLLNKNVISNGMLEFDIDGGKTANFAIYDAMGRVCYNATSDEQTNNIDISFLKSGVYFIVVKNSNTHNAVPFMVVSE